MKSTWNLIWSGSNLQNSQRFKSLLYVFSRESKIKLNLIGVHREQSYFESESLGLNRLRYGINGRNKFCFGRGFEPKRPQKVRTGGVPGGLCDLGEQDQATLPSGSRAAWVLRMLKCLLWNFGNIRGKCSIFKQHSKNWKDFYNFLVFGKILRIWEKSSKKTFMGLGPKLSLWKFLIFLAKPGRSWERS